MHNWCIYFCLNFAFVFVSSNHTLEKVLLDRLHHTGRPAMNEQGLKVYVLGSLYTVVDVDQKNNLVTLSAYFDLRWRDNTLTWNPEEFNDTTHMYLPTMSVWLPELYLYHSVEGSTPIGIQDTAVQVQYFGEVRIFVPFTARALCPINVKYFPFDSQWCNFTFGSWSYKVESVEFEVENSDINLAEFYDNQEWQLTGSHLEKGTITYKGNSRNEHYSTVTMQLHLTRQSFYYVFNLVIPTTLVSLTAIIGFHAPTSSTYGRQCKFRLGITTLLSMGVMLLMVVDEMPKFSLASQPGQRGSFSGVPLLALFYVSLILIISLGTCTSSIFVTLEKYASKRPHIDQIPAVIRWLDFDWPSPNVYRTLDRHRRNHKNTSSRAATALLPDEGTPTILRNCLLNIKGIQQHKKKISTNHGTSLDPENVSPDHYQVVEKNRGLQEYLLEAEVALLEKLCELVSDISNHIAALQQKQILNSGISKGPHQGHLLIKSWRRVILRLEIISLMFYLGIVFLFVLMFYYPQVWY